MSVLKRKLDEPEDDSNLNVPRVMPDYEVEEVDGVKYGRRKRGRPKGKKDAKPRKRRKKNPSSDEEM